MTNIACQLGKIYDHLRDELLGMSVMEFTDLTFHWEDSPNTWGVHALVWHLRLNEEAQSGWALGLVPLFLYGAGNRSRCVTLLLPCFPCCDGHSQTVSREFYLSELTSGKKHVAPSLAACFRFSSSLSVPYKPSWRCRERFPWQRCDFSIAGIDGKDLFGPY